MNVVLSPFHQTLKFIMGEGGGGGPGRGSNMNIVLSPFHQNPEVYNGEGFLGDNAI